MENFVKSGNILDLLLKNVKYFTFKWEMIFIFPTYFVYLYVCKKFQNQQCSIFELFSEFYYYIMIKLAILNIEKDG